VYWSGSGSSERIFSHRNTSGFASMSADTHNTGKSEIENTHGLMKHALQPSHQQSIAARAFSLGHGSASTMARTRAARTGSWSSAKATAVAVERLERLKS